MYAAIVSPGPEGGGKGGKAAQSRGPYVYSKRSQRAQEKGRIILRAIGIHEAYATKTCMARKTVVRPHEERFHTGSMPSSFLEETSHVDVAVRRVSQ